MSHSSKEADNQKVEAQDPADGALADETLADETRADETRADETLDDETMGNANANKASINQGLDKTKSGDKKASKKAEFNVSLNNMEDFNPIRIHDELLQKLPDDLYIPPDALEVILDSFEGPLDLLLYLIRKQNLDILDIPVAAITEQYMEYVNIMREIKLDLAAEYLVMAATLMEIKSKMLLPKPMTEEGEEEDPRAALIRRLQEYERFRNVAMQMDDMPRLERDIFEMSANYYDTSHEAPVPQIELEALVNAFEQIMLRAKKTQNWIIEREVLSVRERMTMVLERLQHCEYLKLEEVFQLSEGRMGLVVSFVAMLELVKDKAVIVLQNAPYESVLIKKQTESIFEMTDQNKPFNMKQAETSLD